MFSRKVDECKPLVVGVSMDKMEKHEEFCTAKGQGLTLVPISAHLELFCPPYNPP